MRTGRYSEYVGLSVEYIGLSVAVHHRSGVLHKVHETAPGASSVVCEFATSATGRSAGVRYLSRVGSGLISVVAGSILVFA
jgi:hypothetical protein